MVIYFFEPVYITLAVRVLVFFDFIFLVKNELFFYFALGTQRLIIFFNEILKLTKSH